MPGRVIKVAAIQSSPISFNLIATIQKVGALVSEAKEAGAELVVLPEAFCSAYPRFWEFGIGTRSEQQREWYGRYVTSSVKVPEDAFDLSFDLETLLIEGEGESGEYWAFGQLSKIARDNQIHLSIGIIERSIHGSTLWCTNLLFAPTGRLLSKHRKLQPTAAERVVWSQGEGTYPTTIHTGSNRDGGKVGSAGEGGGQQGQRGRGDNLPVVKTDLGNIGGLICWENFMPLARYVLYKKGVEIYTAPTADARPTWLPSMQHIAQEGRCYVISANQFHTSHDFPADYPGVVLKKINTSERAAEEIWSRGGSCIIGPLGEILAGPLWDKAGILYADLDMDRLHGARLEL